MPATRSTTIQQREVIARLAEEQRTYRAIGEQLQVSFWTTRKWARRAKHGGLSALVSTLGRPPTGPLAGFDARVRYAALRLKLEHPHWGAAYIVKKMGERTVLSNLALPEATTVWRYWRSFGARLFPARHVPDPPLPPAAVVHGVWQMDFKESMMVAGVGATTFTQARDEFARATVMHRVHPAAQAEQRIVTDRAGLFMDAAHLQRQVDADWHELNTECASRARGCDGQPPVLAHPELLIPRRPYRPEWEHEIFDLGRVDRYLGTFSCTRTMSQSGQVNLGGHVYGLGKLWAGQTVSVGFELEGRRFVFTSFAPHRRPDNSSPSWNQPANRRVG